MSVRVMTAVWAMDLPDSEKIVLLALADCANDEGHCWPSMRSLVAKCTKSDRTIQAAIKRLVDAGHLTRREVLGKGCNYTVHPGRGFAPEKTSPPKGTTETPEAASDKPSRTINSEAKASSQCVVDSWNAMAEKHGLARIRVLDASRRQSLRLRLKEHGEALLLEAIELVGRSPWLRGEGRDSKWRPNFDFILQPASLRKVLEGTYGAEDGGRQLSIPEQIKRAEDNATFWRGIGREDEAAEADRLAARLRAGNGGGSARPAGEVASKILATAGAGR